MPARLIQLHPHPGHPSDGVERLSFSARRVGTGLSAVFNLSGDTTSLEVPVDPAGGSRRDGLWKQTCFELFIRSASGTGYREFNFAPNEDWAAYSFSDYRQNQCDLDCVRPEIATSVNTDGVSVQVLLPDAGIDFASGQIRLGPAAIIETKQAAKSFCAMHHATDKPDFHRTETFNFSLD